MEPGEFEALLGGPGRELMAELHGYDEADALALATKLRARYPAALVSAALTQARLRVRAAAKFGPLADVLFFTPAGLEQSTRRSVAELRARRYAAAGVRRVADLCCGVGGDALAFAAHGIDVLAVDRDPLTCAVVRANAAALNLADRIEVRCADVVKVSPQGEGCDAVFLDPARRTDLGRVFDPAAYSPPWDFAVGLARRVPAAGFKVAPGLPHELIPGGAEGEWVSDRGEVKEAGIYFGPLAKATRSATLLPGAHRLESRGVPDPVPVGIGRYLYEPDGAVIRAHLIGELAQELGAATIDPKIAYLTSDRLVPTPFASAYEVDDVLPFSVKRLKAFVRDQRIGNLTIKKRGVDIDPAVLWKQLHPAGPESAILIVTRVPGAHIAVVARSAR